MKKIIACYLLLKKSLASTSLISLLLTRYSTKKTPSQNRYTLLFFVVLIALLLPASYFTLKNPTSQTAAWFDDTYPYRQRFSFIHNADIDDYRAVTITLDTAELINDGVMQSDCDDTRFTDMHGQQLAYDLTGVCDNTATTYEVVFPNIINGTNVAYVYYGNSNAANAQIDATGYTALTPSGGDPSITNRTNEEKSPSPFAYWKFDEGVDNTCFGGTNDTCDSVGSNDGAKTGATWQSEEMCISGRCLYFDGSDDVITFADTVFGIQAISFWVKVMSTSTTQQLIDLNGTDYITSNSGTVTVSGFGTETIYVDGNVGNTTLTANRWHHIAIVNNATGFDGSDIKIGQVSTDYGNFFIDEVKIYVTSISNVQVRSNYVSRGADNISSVLGASEQILLSDGLVGYWKLDENTGTDITDYSGNGYGGTFSNASWVSGKFGSGIGFSGEEVNDTLEYNAISIGEETSGTSLTFAHTTAGDNRGILVGAATYNGNAPPPTLTATYAGVSMDLVGTSIFGSEEEERVSVFYLNAPTLGENNVVLTSSQASSEIIAAAVSVTGVHQSDSIRDFDVVTKINDTSHSTSIDSAVNDLVVDFIGWYNSTLTANGSQSVRSNNNNGTSYESLAVSTKAGGSPTTTMVWGASPSRSAGHGVVSLRPNTISAGHIEVAIGPNQVKSVSFWVNPESTSEHILDLNGSAYIWVDSGVLNATGFVNPIIYVNGEISSTISADVWQFVTITTDTDINASQLEFGRQDENYFTGVLDEIRFYNRTDRYPKN